MMKLFTWWQAWWSKFLSQFNLTIWFHPRKLSMKPDALTRQWDVYLKEGGNTYKTINPQNLRPIFTTTQFMESLRATSLITPILQASITMDSKKLLADIKAHQAVDNKALKHLNDASDLRWTQLADGLLQHDNRIYVPETRNLQLRVLQYKHNHTLLGHFSQNKTLASVHWEYTWPGLQNFLTKFCKSCMTCMHSKSQHHRPYGLLKQLPILEQPWNSISMDFIEQLPKSSGYTAILVVVDCLTKQAIFILTHDTITLADLAKLFVLHVFSKHSIPSHITSNHKSEFVSHFFRSLRKALDMWLHFTSGYHLGGDSQTERTNQTLEQYLWVYSNYQQDNWSDLLPLTEFAYNNAPSATTRISPFYTNKGYHPNISVHLECELASGRACDFAINLDELHTTLKEQIKTAQSRYQALADAHHVPAPSFPIGSYAFMKV